MNDKKIFMVETDFNYHGDDGHNTYLFSNETAAKDYAKRLVDEFKDNDHLMDSDTAVIEEEVEKLNDRLYWFCAYEDGEYCEDHFTIKVCETIILDSANEVFGI